MRNFLRSTLSAMSPPTGANRSAGPSWAKMMTPDERTRVGEVVGVGTEDDVLHPGSDVGGECPEEDDAKSAVPQAATAVPVEIGLSPSTTASSISSTETSGSVVSPSGSAGTGHGTGNSRPARSRRDPGPITQGGSEHRVGERTGASKAARRDADETWPAWPVRPE